jgi:SAM-dependent methyltransferase
MTGPLLVSAAQAAAAALGGSALPCDLYDEVGSAIYHDITLGDDSELREILALLRSAPAGPVLELAAGAGRMSLPIAAGGRSVTALDASPSLLRTLAERLPALVPPARDRLATVVGDMADFDLGRRFAVVLLGSTSITLLSPGQRQGLYRCVRAHLEPGGIFLVTVPVPAGDAAEVAEIHRIVTGWSGRQYDMYDAAVPGQDHRTVTVIPRPAPDDAAGDPVPVAVSRPRLFDGRLVGTELAEHGFGHRGEVAIGDCTERLDVLVQVWEVRS